MFESMWNNKKNINQSESKYQISIIHTAKMTYGKKKSKNFVMVNTSLPTMVFNNSL